MVTQGPRVESKDILSAHQQKRNAKHQVLEQCFSWETSLLSQLQSENGVIRKVDCSRVMVNKLNPQTQIDNLNQLYQEQTSLLKYLAVIDTRTVIVLTDSLTTPTDSAFLHKSDIKPRIELQLFYKQIQVASLDLKMSKESYLPSLVAFAQHYYQAQNNDFNRTIYRIDQNTVYVLRIFHGSKLLDITSL
jgi:hypothetical protein